MKIMFIKGKPDCGWNSRVCYWRGLKIMTRGTFIPKGNIDIEYKKDETVKKEYDEDQIIVVKQPTMLKTAFILFHELCHWLVAIVFRHNHPARRKWHNRIDKYL